MSGAKANEYDDMKYYWLYWPAFFRECCARANMMGPER